MSLSEREKKSAKAMLDEWPWEKTKFRTTTFRQKKICGKLMFNYPKTKVTNKGDSGCSTSSKCGVGEGDCDTDADCKTGLKCGQRDILNFPDPGLYGYAPHGNDNHVDDDYCYDPQFNTKNVNKFISAIQPFQNLTCPGVNTYLCPSESGNNYKNQICINSTVALTGTDLATFLKDTCPITGIKLLKQDSATQAIIQADTDSKFTVIQFDDEYVFLTSKTDDNLPLTQFTATQSKDHPCLDMERFSYKNKKILNHGGKVPSQPEWESQLPRQKGKKEHKMTQRLEEKDYPYSCIYDSNIGESYDQRYKLIQAECLGYCLWTRPVIEYEQEYPCPGQPKAMYEIMLSLREATKNIEVVFVENYNKAKIMADLQLWLVGAFLIVFGGAAMMGLFPLLGLWLLFYILMLYIPRIHFDPRLADTREFDEVAYVLDENALFENTCLGKYGQISLPNWQAGMKKEHTKYMMYFTLQMLARYFPFLIFSIIASVYGYFFIQDSYIKSSQIAQKLRPKHKRSDKQMEDYLDISTGLYACPDCYCDYRNQQMQEHFEEMGHGYYKLENHYRAGTKRNECWAKNYWNHSQKLYECPEPDCNYSFNTIKAMQEHFEEMIHGNRKNKKYQNPITNAYECPEPDCNFYHTVDWVIQEHFEEMKHGNCKEEPQEENDDEQRIADEETMAGQEEQRIADEEAAAAQLEQRIADEEATAAQEEQRIADEEVAAALEEEDQILADAELAAAQEEEQRIADEQAASAAAQEEEAASAVGEEGEY